jgi:hypothetical protein
MRIINNKIFIARGETPTYSARVIDKDSGAPFIIDKTIAMNPDNTLRTIILEFVVRDSAYSRDEDKRIRRHLILKPDETYHMFDDLKIIEYKGSPIFTNNGEDIVWDDLYIPEQENINRLHRYSHLGDNFYCRYDIVTKRWITYDFEFNVTFMYSETSVMEPKTYKYEIALLAGNDKDVEAGEIPIEIEFKKRLLDLTDFTVEGSISE